MDGASHQARSDIGLQLKSPTGERIEQAIRLGFNASNNESEYEAILAGIELVIIVQLVVGQVKEEYESRDPRMAKYVSLVKQRLDNFSAWKLEHATKDCNEKVDALAAIAASFPIIETMILPIYYQPDSSIVTTRVSQVEEVSFSWMDPIVRYINTGEFPNDRNKAHKTQVQSGRFSMVNGQLFKWSLDGPYLKFLNVE